MGDKKVVNVVLCGGVGSRLWPISTKQKPKQFCLLVEDKSLFQLNLLRNKKYAYETIFVTSDNFIDTIRQQVDALDLSEHHMSFIREPIGRNTAPAIALACFLAPERSILLATPSDHIITDTEEYNRVLNQAILEANKGKIVTFGVTPSAPETNYGYIETERIDNFEEFAAIGVKKFHEKPDYERAKDYFESNNFYWNSGIFCFQPEVFLSELKCYAPEVYKTAKKAAAKMKKDKNNTYKIELEDMEQIPSISADYAVMEHSKKVVCIPSDFGWSDLGSFNELYKYSAKDLRGNVMSKNAHSIDTSGSYIYSKSGKNIVAIGLEDMVIVETDDTILISKRNDSQRIGIAAKKLNKL